jgi:hypothetical protein
LADSLDVCQAPPPVPEPAVEDAKVKVVELGWPVEVNVPLNPATLSPATVRAAPVGNAQLELQVTVATDPLPEMLETKPPTKPATT